MYRFIIFDPKTDSYVRMSNGGWTSGHKAEEVNSYSSLSEARMDVAPFESLKHCEIVRVLKTIQISKRWSMYP